LSASDIRLKRNDGYEAWLITSQIVYFVLILFWVVGVFQNFDSESTLTNSRWELFIIKQKFLILTSKRFFILSNNSTPQDNVLIKFFRL